MGVYKGLYGAGSTLRRCGLLPSFDRVSRVLTVTGSGSRCLHVRKDDGPQLARGEVRSVPGTVAASRSHPEQSLWLLSDVSRQPPRGLSLWQSLPQLWLPRSAQSLSPFPPPHFAEGFPEVALTCCGGRSQGSRGAVATFPTAPTPGSPGPGEGSLAGARGALKW